jgi:hypothetical protein
MKLLLNALVMGIEALPRGGTLSVVLDPAAKSATLESSGKGARIEVASKEALARRAAVDALTARNVHAYFTSLVAADAGGTVELSEETDRVTLKLSVS